MHTSVARRAGYGPGLIARAVEQGLVQRIRRSWIVGMDADHPTIASLRAGGRITCVSALARIGIWVPPGASADPRVHVAVAGNASRFDSAGLRVHWGKGPAPIALRAVVEHPLNVLFHVSECLELTPALAVWDSAANKSVVSAAALARVEWRGRRAQELARATSVLSDSGLETHAAVGFRALGLGVRQQVWIGGQPVDLLIGDRLVVQVDGAHHLDKTQRRRDISHDAKLRLMGYTVFRFDYQQVLFDWPLVESTVTMAVAQGLHRSDGR
ncbi:DUF559 domain-containing protein [Microbacterium sp. BK668]|uniref:endonuclease domain-containing protein n=1 Tax=Microbacterium sp. BK668 TaxID=2512118 RepID=UPI001414D18E|nr:DUF559 domain-containing protein [Microbacterium sp. BK668]